MFKAYYDFNRFAIPPEGPGSSLPGNDLAKKPCLSAFQQSQMLFKPIAAPENRQELPKA